MSVPMTLSDLARRDAKGHIFGRISVVTVVQFDGNRPKSGGGNIYVGGRVFTGKPPPGMIST